MTNFEKYHKESIEKGYTAVKNEKLTSCDDVILIMNMRGAL